MVSFWPWRGSDNSPASFEKALSHLSKRLADTNIHLDKLRHRSRRFRALWTLYTSFVYILYSLILVLVLGQGRWGPIEYTAICGGPVVIYVVRLAAEKFYNYRISHTQNVLDDLQKQRDQTIEKLKEATKYNSTQLLLEKYGGDSAKLKRSGNDAGSDEGRGSQKRRTPKDRTPLPLPERRTGLAPPPTANIRQIESGSISPPPQAQHDRPHTSAGFSPRPRAQVPAQADEPEFHPSAFSASVYTESRPPRWYDRVLDVLLGEDETLPKNRLVLICQQCRLVNGQAAPGVRTLEELGAWRCGSCGVWNNQDGQAKGIATGALPADALLSTHSRTRSQSLPHHPGQSPGTTEPPSSPERTWEPVPRPGSISSAVDGGDNPAMEGRDVTAAHAAPSSEDGLEAGDKFEASDDFVEDRGAK
ncbi:uncharacterized protein CIMG_08888 [Coccidioides immitis RS]|uniref:Endoplasmic reticulum junction formation protein lunapark n=3 Tax=Coccidioides immitis TaxID=5501 RepID=J3K6E9_COCIM|nr:uncharacterized protein CIMG_08888 [Coccidioides immitis RS]EAS30142.3 hypothetical protein CIMG_08888 [Coccidioides immitis RS]KMP07091.1 hypothetical protein CIRG_06772 [Coccidioides immitis RMSCC 2394]KMU86816.1 hypothetical protein CIHG_04605 [Coccidioides immitis H538.4]